MQWFVDWLIDMTIKMDWKQFIPSLFATFVGIFVPFGIQRRHEKKQRRKEAYVKTQQIKEELIKAKSDIGAISEISLNINPVKTPIGDSLLNTQEMQLLADLRRYHIKKTKDSDPDKDWYQLIIRVYADLSEYNHWWNIYTEQFVSKSDSRKERWTIENVTREQVLEFIKAKFDLSLIKQNLDQMKDTLCSDKDNPKSIDYLLELLENIPKI